MSKRIWIALLLAGGLGLPHSAFADLWLGNDTIGDVFRTTNTGTVLTQLPSYPITGIASDGVYVYFADRAGTIEKRTWNGSTVVGSFFVPTFDTGEDMAWDSQRSVLWRIVHTNLLQKIDASTGTLLGSTVLPTADPILGPLGGLGIAYDSLRDLLYVSYCQAGCTGLAKGLVNIVDPDTMAVTGELFRTDFYAGGLGYDGASDTLWMGGAGSVYHTDLAGAILSSFARPQPGAFVDGLEYVSSVPEPASLALMATIGGILGIAYRRRRNG